MVQGLTDWASHKQDLLQTFTPLWRHSYAAGALTARKLYSLQAIQPPELISVAKLMGGQRISMIQQTTKENVGRIVTQGLINGDTQHQIAQQICEEMKTTTARAHLIAAQEARMSLNAGHFDMCRKGGAEWKVWHHMPQKNPRDWHEAMEGERVPFDSPFSNGLMYPADPMGDAEETINCRCYYKIEWGDPPPKKARELPKLTKSQLRNLTFKPKHDIINISVKADDGVDWITVNGARIPLKDGEPQGEVGQKITGKLSASGANPSIPPMTDKNLKKHWGGTRDHSSQYPSLTKKTYAKRAVNLARSPIGGNVDGYKAKDGAIVRYDKVTNDYVKAYSTGVATMFKPDDAAEYSKRKMLREGGSRDD
ncbi:hypothetical protein FACS1894184_14750 [Clostridia bacterium]|nr:hypothetical protein FACS1894184_14750 [Clostridia bacterium]